MCWKSKSIFTSTPTFRTLTVVIFANIRARSCFLILYFQNSIRPFFSSPGNPFQMPGRLFIIWSPATPVNKRTELFIKGKWGIHVEPFHYFQCLNHHVEFCFLTSRHARLKFKNFDHNSLLNHFKQWLQLAFFRSIVQYHLVLFLDHEPTLWPSSLISYVLLVLTSAVKGGCLWCVLWLNYCCGKFNSDQVLTTLWKRSNMMLTFISGGGLGSTPISGTFFRLKCSSKLLHSSE